MATERHLSRGRTLTVTTEGQAGPKYDKRNFSVDLAIIYFVLMLINTVSCLSQFK